MHLAILLSVTIIYTYTIDHHCSCAGCNKMFQGINSQGEIRCTNKSSEIENLPLYFSLYSTLNNAN